MSGLARAIIDLKKMKKDLYKKNLMYVLLSLVILVVNIVLQRHIDLSNYVVILAYIFQISVILESLYIVYINLKTEKVINIDIKDFENTIRKDKYEV